MRRRDFVALLSGAVTTWPLAARAEQAVRMPHIGVLIANEEKDREQQARLTGFRQGLEQLGWSDGRNVQLSYRFAEGKADQFQPLAKELVASRPDVIVAQSPPVVAAVQRETSSIPIVFVDVADPISLGFVESLARPGGNLTGLLSFEQSVCGKWLAMLKEISPGLQRVALVGNPKTTAFDYFLQAVMKPALGIEVIPTKVETASDIKRTIEFFARTPNGGLIFPPDTTTILHRDLVISIAAQNGLPAVYPFRIFVMAGGLMSYSIDFVYEYRQAASCVGLILRGTKPAEIPVQAPTRFETVLNLKTAKALGISVPAGLLVAADEVIE